MQDRLFVIDAIKILGYKKRESFNKWCRLNSVSIFSDIGSNRHFILKTDFDLALSKTPIKIQDGMYNLKSNPGMFDSHMRITSELRSFKESKCKPDKINYVPSQEHEKAILVKWTEELGEV